MLSAGGFRDGPARACRPHDTFPLDEVYHLAYAIESDGALEEREQLVRLVQSAGSAFAVGCGSAACRARLLVHIFYQGIRTEELHRALAPLTLRGLRAAMHATDFEREVTRQRAVWGYGKSDSALQHKLMKAANYFRFYIPDFLRRTYGAQAFLYLDSDTVFRADGLEELLVARPLPLALAGKQEKKWCTLGKMLLLDDPRLSRLGLKPDGACITASAMVYNTSAWAAANMTAKVERLLAENAKAKLWHLGSMPPLMVALHGRWTSLPSSIVKDGKGSDCSWLQRTDEGSRPLLVHPFKSLCAHEMALSATVCMEGDFTAKRADTGSRRIMGMQAAALATLLGGRLQPLSSRCDVVVSYGAPPTLVSAAAAHRRLHVVYKPRSDEAAPALAPAVANGDGAESVLVVADNGYIAAMWEAKQQPHVRLQLVEDMRPGGARHEPWPGKFNTGEALREAGVGATRRAVLCYHGNTMHLHSVLPLLGGVRLPFTLRVIMPRTGSKTAITRLEEALRRASLPHGAVVEQEQYDAERIHAQLQGCDVGLAPSEVASNVSAAELSKQTARWFDAEGVQREDSVRRCKRTENAGRAFIFFQLGVPTVVDACTEAVLFSSAHEAPTALVAYRADAWVPLINRLLTSPQLRLDLSRNSRAFALEHLTSRAQAVKLLDSLSCMARSHLHAGSAAQSHHRQPPHAGSAAQSHHRQSPHAGSAAQSHHRQSPHASSAAQSHHRQPPKVHKVAKLR